MHRLWLASLSVALAVSLGAGLAGAAGGIRIGFASGWKPLERDGSGRTFRWMGSNAELLVYGGGTSKVRLSLQATSLVRQRTLTLRYRGRVVRTVRVPPRWRWASVTVTLPQGSRPARILLNARPAPESASRVVARDKRLLAVAVSRLRVAPVR